MARYDGRVPCTEIPERAPFSNPACHPPVWGALLEFALRFRQGSWLDQQALSFIAVSAPAEAHHHGVPWAFRLGSTREQRIPGGQIFKIVETRTSQARRARIFHDEKTTAAAAPVTRPRIMQRFDRRVSTLAEAQRSPRRRLRDIVGLTWDQSLRCGPRPKQLHGLGNARQIGLHGPFEMVELPLLPAFDRSGIKPSDPDQHIDRTDIFPSRERYLGCLDHAIAELLAIVRLHDVVARVERSLL